MSGIVDTALPVREALSAADGDFSKIKAGKNKAGTISAEQIREKILLDMPSTVKMLDSLRSASSEASAIDISFNDIVKEKWGFSVEKDDAQVSRSFLDALGIDPSRHSIEKLYNMGDFPDGYRWLIPEVYRTAINTGLRRAPVYPSLIAMEENVPQLLYNMPYLNMSDAMPTKINEAESIPVGDLSFGQKSVKLKKIAIGLSLTDEVVQFSSINLLSKFLEDVGVKMNIAQDTDAINTLLNGDQADGSDAITTVGVASSGTLAYKDILKVWLRMSRLGRLPAAMLAGEDMTISILELPEFKGFAGESTTARINVKTPIPKVADIIPHGAITDPDSILFVDKSAALIKLNVGALKMESERIANKQISKTYASMFTGFATMFRDARILLLRDSTAGFNDIFNVNAVEQETYR